MTLPHRYPNTLAPRLRAAGRARRTDLPGQSPSSTPMQHADVLGEQHVARVRARQRADDLDHARHADRLFGPGARVADQRRRRSPGSRTSRRTALPGTPCRSARPCRSSRGCGPGRCRRRSAAGTPALSTACSASFFQPPACTRIPLVRSRPYSAARRYRCCPDQERETEDQERFSAVLGPGMPRMAARSAGVRARQARRRGRGRTSPCPARPPLRADDPVTTRRPSTTSIGSRRSPRIAAQRAAPGAGSGPAAAARSRQIAGRRARRPGRREHAEHLFGRDAAQFVRLEQADRQPRQVGDRVEHAWRAERGEDLRRTRGSAVLWCSVRARQFGDQRSAPRLQCLIVDLAVGQQRKAVDAVHVETGRVHAQPCRQRAARPRPRVAASAPSTYSGDPVVGGHCRHAAPCRGGPGAPGRRG